MPLQRECYFTPSAWTIVARSCVEEMKDKREDRECCSHMHIDVVMRVLGWDSANVRDGVVVGLRMLLQIPLHVPTIALCS